VRAARRGQPTLTIGLVVALVAIWLLQQTSDQWFLRGALAGPLVASGEWWRVVTGAFLHDQNNILHVGFNAYLLYLLGQMLEPGIGTSRFAAIYTAGLLGGSAGALLLSWGAATIGASGAVFGLMGAAMVGFRQRGINPWRTGVGMLVVLNLVFTFLVANVSVGGHIGGLVGGALAGWPIFHSHIGRTRAGIAVAWGIAFGLGVLAIGLGVAGPVI
jgi:membrane associated rhomboid family serine protease